MPTIRKPDVLIIGVGNEDRGDDQAGLIAARLIRSQVPSLQVVVESGEATALIDLWRSSSEQKIYLIDAMVSGQSPGAVQRFDVQRETLPQALRGDSSHLLGVAQAVELARALGVLPAQFIIYGIEAKSFNFGDRISPEVNTGARSAAERILAECLRSNTPEH